MDIRKNFRRVACMILATIMICGLFVASFAEAYAASMTLEIAGGHKDSAPIESLYDPDVHFLWDESYYIDESGTRHANAFYNHPSSVSWEVDESEQSLSSYTRCASVSSADAARITRKLGASDKFCKQISTEGYDYVEAPNLMYSYNDMYVDVDFTFDPDSVELDFRRKYSTAHYADMDMDWVYYVPVLKGCYTLTFYDDYSSGRQTGKMVIPVSCEIHYMFKSDTNLSDESNEGYSYCWNNMLVNYSFVSRVGFDCEWILGDYYKHDDMICDDVVLEVGQTYDIRIANTNPEDGVYEYKGPDKYYIVEENGIRECKSSELPYDLGYHPECGYVSDNGRVTATKPGTFRVDSYFPDSGTYLSYKITVKGDQSRAKFVIGQSSYTAGGKSMAMDAPPYIDSNNRTMVPIRYIAYACGVDENSIGWDQATQTASIKAQGGKISIKMGSSSISTPTGTIAMDTAAVNQKGRIYVPLRFIANALGAEVGWEQATKTITLM